MATLKDLVRDTQGDSKLDSLGGLWYGRVAPPLPPTLADFLFVTLPDVAPLVKFGPCKWPQSAIPSLDAEVLVAFDNRGNPWVVSIWQT